MKDEIKYRENDEEILRKRPHNIKCSRLRFSMRTRNYWNLLPKEIRHLEYHFFKREAKKFVVENQDRFLNFGNKDKTHPKYLDPIKPYVPPKVRAKVPPEMGGVLKKQANNQRQRYRETHGQTRKLVETKKAQNSPPKWQYNQRTLELPSPQQSSSSSRLPASP